MPDKQCLSQLSVFPPSVMPDKQCLSQLSVFPPSVMPDKQFLSQLSVFLPSVMPDKQFLSQLAGLENVDPVSIYAYLTHKWIADEDFLRITKQFQETLAPQ